MEHVGNVSYNASRHNGSSCDVTTGYHEPDVECHEASNDNDDAVQRLLANDLAIAGLEVSLVDQNDDSGAQINLLLLMAGWLFAFSLDPLCRHQV